jgi:DDE superfamily endonuclease
MADGGQGVFLGYAGRYGQALINRTLYLPADWANAERRREAHIPADIAFATKLKLGLVILARALDRHPVCWINGDSVYGADPRIRHWADLHEPRGSARGLIKQKGCEEAPVAPANAARIGSPRATVHPAASWYSSAPAWQTLSSTWTTCVSRSQSSATICGLPSKRSGRTPWPFRLVAAPHLRCQGRVVGRVSAVADAG